tara:strand:- start:10517 stop:11542 length:1026 start_codon:yes stop_codon:yes gene_type:complete
MAKLLVLYVFHIYNDRVADFIKNAIFKDENVDFIIICNCDPIKFDFPNYVKIIFRENKGCDFGGWSDGLLTNDLYKDYDNFIFVNSSVTGPYLDSNYKGKWTDKYINGLKNNVKLFGSTINTMTGLENCSLFWNTGTAKYILHNDKISPTQNLHNVTRRYKIGLKTNLHKTKILKVKANKLGYAHVQSYIFSINKEALEYLIEKNIFSNTQYTENIQETIIWKEIRMSRLIIEKNWNIGSLFKNYDGFDFTFSNQIIYDKIIYDKIIYDIWNPIITKTPRKKTPRKKTPFALNKVKYYHDIMYPGFEGKLWTRNELVFIKGNRDDARIGRGHAQGRRQLFR